MQAGLTTVLVLVSTTTTTGAAEERPDPHQPSFWFRSLTAARYNPLGLLAFARGMFRAPLYRSDSDALKTNFAGVGVDVSLSPAFVRAGFLAEIQPLSILHLWFLAEGIAYNGAFDFLQSFPSATSSWSDTDFETLGALPEDDPRKNYATTGSEITFGATLRLKLGPIAARSLFRLSRASYDLKDGHQVIYENRFELLIPNDGWYFNNDVDLLFVTDFGLAAGARWTFARAFFTDEHFALGEDPDMNPNPMTHRVGPFVAYRFFTEPRGTTWFNNPTMILIVNWWLKHRHRTGEDVSQAIPYVILGFLFNGEAFF